MFVLPPSLPFLPGIKREQLLAFGDANQLKQGVLLTDKANEEKKTIHSLRELELDRKYLTEEGCTVQRITDSQIIVKKKPPGAAVPSKAAATPRSSSPSPTSPLSLPSSVPSSSSAIRIPSQRGAASFHRRCPSSGGEEDREAASWVTTGSGSRDSYGCSPFTSSFEEGVEFINKSPPSNSMGMNWLGPSVGYQYNNDTFKALVEIERVSIPGEQLHHYLKNVSYAKVVGSKTTKVSGCLYFTNYQLIFMSEGFSQSSTNAQLPPWMNQQQKSPGILFLIPLTSIAKMEKVDRSNSHFMFGGELSYSLDIYSKEFRRKLRFSLTPGEHSRKEVCDYLRNYISPRSPSHLFALCSQQPLPDEGWKLVDLKREYQRMGVGLSTSSGWKFTDVNSTYGLCDSYPTVLVIPDKFPEDELYLISEFRSKGRIPVLCWRDVSSGASITRCSQPRTGTRTRNASDEKLVEHTVLSNKTAKKLHILDARPYTNAWANMTMGGGYEEESWYAKTEFRFLGIGNIHLVRDSWTKLRDVCEAHTQSIEGDGTNVAASCWLSQLESTHWLDILSSILCSAVTMAHLIDVKKESVLVHCSDGWDRTPQLCSLAELLLDGHLRTLEGFLVLIEKEWLSFGHKFADRVGPNFGEGDKTQERSPVFVQFLDTVWQVMQQFPHSFEFTEDLLITIIENVHSSRFGTFLFNNEKEREEANLATSSPSLWTYILQNKESYMNPFYQQFKGPAILYPACNVNNLHFWSRYYLRHFASAPQIYENQFIPLGKEMKANTQRVESELRGITQERDLLLQRIKELEIASNRTANPNEKKENGMNTSREAFGSMTKPKNGNTEESLDTWVDLSDPEDSLSSSASPALFIGEQPLMATV